jgi:hypothetical protein
LIALKACKAYLAFMKKILFLIAFLSLNVHANSLVLKTNLGAVGNKLVAQNYRNYQKEFMTKGCKANGPGKRVILTGFGLFSGVNYNISGAVVSSMSNPALFPAKIDLSNVPTLSMEGVDDGRLESQLFGVKIANRSLEMNGKLFEVCFITANVEWDFAAAVFINEMKKFKPELIIMSGRGGSEVSLEAGALNNATKSPGYFSNGQSEENNTPVSNGEKLLKNYSKNFILKLNWDAHKINNVINETVASLGYKVEVQTDARASNNYICNNVSFLVANAALNKTSVLVNGALILPSPELKTLPKVGFFHFPSVDYSYPEITNYVSQIFTWETVLAKAIYSQFY